VTWLKIDDHYATHQKIIRAGPVAMALDIAGMCYSASHGTDGFVPAEALPVVAPLLSKAKAAASVAKLIEVGRWIKVDDGWEIHDFLVYNPSAAERDERLALHARRQALFRDKDLRQLVRERDHDHCRYCGVGVRWRDRKGPLGGTYDHIDPKGPNSLENLVIACRSCNSKKKDRTPADAGMDLLPIYLGSTAESNYGSTADQAPDLLPHVRASDPGPSPSSRPKTGRDDSPQPPAASPAGSSQAAADLAAEPQNNGQPATAAQKALLRAALERRRQDADAEEVNEP
jgi:hypothetical protein